MIHPPPTSLFLMAILVITTTFNCVDAAAYCDAAAAADKIILTRMFKVGVRVYFGDTAHLYHYDLKSKKSHKVGGRGDHALLAAHLAIHFDVYKACSPDHSSLLFCERAQLYQDMVIVVGGAGNVSFHTVKGAKLTPFATPQDRDKAGLLPSLNARQFATISLLFAQVAGNDQLTFTGATFEQWEDTMYLTATVLAPAVVRDASWSPHGAHVMFASTFETGSGLVPADGYVVASFERPTAGLIDWNGALYVLESGTNTILEWRNGSLTGTVCLIN
jgi:hypothetical protein